MAQLNFFPLPDGTVLANPIYFPKITIKGVEWDCEVTTRDRILAKTPDGNLRHGMIYSARPVIQPFVSRLLFGVKNEREYQMESLDDLAKMKLLKYDDILSAYNLPKSTPVDDVPPAYRNVSVVAGSWMLYIHDLPRDEERRLPALRVRY